MKRFERRRFERVRRIVTIVGVSFSLGALANEALGRRVRAAIDHEPPYAVGEVPRPPDETFIGTSGSRETPIAVTNGLRDRHLEIPVDGVDRSELHDTFRDTRDASRPHEAIDIMAPRGTPVRAADDGTIQKLFTSKAGGLTIYQFEPSQRFSYYYAHLDRYADGIAEGRRVRRGEILGYVGSTGNASPTAPHLHFAIFELTPERQWWKGTPINPYDLLK